MCTSVDSCGFTAVSESIGQRLPVKATQAKSGLTLPLRQLVACGCAPGWTLWGWIGAGRQSPSGVRMLEGAGACSKDAFPALFLLGGSSFLIPAKVRAAITVDAA